MLTVCITDTVISEINYNYELESVQSNYNMSARFPQCYLLMGRKEIFAEKETNQTAVYFEKSINIPLQLNEGQFQYDSSQLQRRIQLIQTVNDDLLPCGLLTLNSNYYDYGNVLNSLGDIVEVVFKYDPNREELKLRAFARFDLPSGIWKEINYEIESCGIKLLGKGDNNTEGVEESQHNNTSNNADNSNLSQTDEFKAFEIENNKQEELSRKIIKRIDQILEYLQEDHNNNDEIIRKISLLINTLHKEPTMDIEQELLNKENEIRILQILCNQWEILN